MKTHIEDFYSWVSETPDKVFLRQPYGNTWKEITYKQAYDTSARIASALVSNGIKKGDAVAIFSKNCYHWVLTDIAIMMTGAVSVPFYPTITGDELKDLLHRSHCKMLFVGKLDAFTPAHVAATVGTATIRFPEYPGNAEVRVGSSWTDLEKDNLPLPKPFKPDINDSWTMLFTSGTTGSPKGVLLSYKAPAALMDMERKNHAIGLFRVKEYRYISYLPLNHIAERMIVEGACFVTGGTISFGESLETFAKNLASIEPTVFMSVPRLYTKMQLAVLEKLGGEKRFNLLTSLPVVSFFIKRKIRKALGLGRVEVILTGAAPTPDSVKNWYKKIGINLREVYGMTENSGGCSLMPADNIKPGTVGKPLPGVDIKIGDENEEIMMRADWMMTGYYNEPEKTAAVFKDGYLLTGDRGELDAEGFLKITGRVSDSFKTAKGKFIIPAPIEWLFAKNEHIEQVCIVGIGAPQPLALISLSPMGKQIHENELNKSLSVTLGEVNAGLANYQKVGKIVVAREEWTVENGIMTPSMKIKRNVIDKRFLQHYETWSAATEEIIYH